MHALEGEGQHRGLVHRGADDLDAGKPRELGGGEIQQAPLVSAEGGEPQLLDIVHRGCEPDGARDVGRAGLELPRQLVVGGLLEGDGEDHVAASLPGRHGGEQLLAAVEHADPGGPVELVAREGVEIRAQRTHVDARVGHRLGAVDEHHRAHGVGRLDEAPDGQHRAEGVGDFGHCHEARTRAEELEERLELELAAAVDRRYPERTTGLLAHDLPGDDVGVVLEGGDEDLIALPEARPGVGLGDEVDTLRRPAHEDDLARRARIDEAPHALAGTFEGGGRRLAERMHAAMHVGMRVGLVLLDGTQHRTRALRGGGAVEIDERMPVHHRLQDGEIAPNPLGIERRRREERNFSGHRTLRARAPAARGASRSGGAAPRSRSRPRRPRGTPTSGAAAPLRA